MDVNGLTWRAALENGPATPVSLVFLGSPEPSASCLRLLAAAGHDVRLVISEPDRRRGRGLGISPTPVKQAAIDLGLPVSEHLADALEAQAELGVVVAFGRLIPKSVLARLDMVNVHFSLLPEWRGAAPIERAILSGQRTTGVSIMKLEEGLDTGPVYASAEVPIAPEATLHHMRGLLAVEGSQLLLGLLHNGVAGLPAPVPQAGEATYARKITAADRRVDWSAGAAAVERVVMIGGAWTTFRGRRAIISAAKATLGGNGRPGGIALSAAGQLLVSTSDGTIEVTEIQLEGRRRQAAAEWARGARLLAGDAFA
ncbi:MAG: methionyl-tRNA formyltransferase [Acidimicrobiales bacterium]